MSRGPGSLQRKILLLLKGGAALSFASISPKTYFKTLREMSREFEVLKSKNFVESVNALYRSNLIGYREKPNGEVSILLNKAGKKYTLTFKIEELKISKPLRWDRRWRIVLFDIPHSLRKTRDSFRLHLKRLGFIQLQKSVFIHPFPCDNEIEFLTELYDLRPFVRQILATHVDNELDIKSKFELT